MKKLLISVLVALSMLSASAQQPSYNREGNNFTAVSTTTNGRASADIKTPYTWEIKGVKYPIYLTKRNKCYIKRVSKKTGKEYKQYLSAEVTAEIVRLMSENNR